MGLLADTRIAFITAHEFEDIEVLVPLMRFSEEGADITIAAPPKDMPGHFSPRSYHPDKPITGRFGTSIPFVVLEEGKRWHMKDVADLSVDDFDAVFLPGGFGPDAVRLHEPSRQFVAAMYRAGKHVAAICHGQQVLISVDLNEGTDILRGRQATCYAAVSDDLINAGAEHVDAPAVVAGTVITGRVPDDLPEFCRAVIDAIAGKAADGVYTID